MANYTRKAMSISTFEIKQCKLSPTLTVLGTYSFCMHECAHKTILCARKSVHANIKFVEPCSCKILCSLTWKESWISKL